MVPILAGRSAPDCNHRQWVESTRRKPNIWSPSCRDTHQVSRLCRSPAISALVLSARPRMVVHPVAALHMWARVSDEQDTPNQLAELHQWLGGAAWRSAPSTYWVGVRVHSSVGRSGMPRAQPPAARCVTPASVSGAGRAGPDRAAESAKPCAKPGITANGKLIGTII